jgi:uncharacterized protein YxeA
MKNKVIIIIIVVIVIVGAVLFSRITPGTNGDTQNAPITSQETKEKYDDSLEQSSNDSSDDNASTESEESFVPLEIVEDYTVDFGEEDEGLEGAWG